MIAFRCSACGKESPACEDCGSLLVCGAVAELERLRAQVRDLKDAWGGKLPGPERAELERLRRAKEQP